MKNIKNKSFLEENNASNADQEKIIKKTIKIYIKYFTNINHIVITAHYREKSRSVETDLTLEKGT